MNIEKIRIIAVKQLHDKANEYSGKADCCEDSLLKEIYVTDAEKLHDIADSLELSHDSLAQAQARVLDTSVREDIPCVAWPLLRLEPLPHFEEKYKLELKKVLGDF